MKSHSDQVITVMKLSNEDSSPHSFWMARIPQSPLDKEAAADLPKLSIGQAKLEIKFPLESEKLARQDPQQNILIELHSSMDEATKASVGRVLYIEQVDLVEAFNSMEPSQKIPFIINSGSEALNKQLSKIDQRKVKPLVVSGLISISTSTLSSTQANAIQSHINHLSVGSRTFFAVISERR